MARGGRRPDGVLGGVRWHSGTLYGALRRRRRIAYRAQLYCTATAEASSNRTTIRPIAGCTIAPDRVPRVTRTRYARRRRCGTGCRRLFGRDEEGPPRSIRTTGAPRSGQPSNGYTTRSLTDDRISPSVDCSVRRTQLHTRSRPCEMGQGYDIILSSSAHRSTEDRVAPSLPHHRVGFRGSRESGVRGARRSTRLQTYIQYNMIYA